jgi:hypothetical protein
MPVPIYDIFDGIDRFVEPHAASTLVRFDGGDPPNLASSPEACQSCSVALSGRASLPVAPFQ